MVTLRLIGLAGLVTRHSEEDLDLDLEGIDNRKVFTASYSEQ